MRIISLWFRVLSNKLDEDNVFESHIDVSKLRSSYK